MPAGPLLRSAGIAVLALSAAASACERTDERAAPEPRLLQLDSAIMPLPDSVRLLTVTLDGALAADLQPAELAVRVGDIVRFEARDATAHAIGFDGTALDGDARRFLEVTGQLRSPPLLAAGTAWVVSFAAAPPGEYPFTCATHGARGRITVRPR